MQHHPTTPIGVRQSVIEGYEIAVMSERSDRLIEIKKPDGTVYRMALDENGPILCTCPGFAYRLGCKHQGIVERALVSDGIPFRAGGRLMLRVGMGLVDVERPDPFEGL